MKRNAVSQSRIPEIGPDIDGRHCDARIEPMRGSKSLDHGGRQSAALAPVTMPQQGHHPIFHLSILVRDLGDAVDFYGVSWLPTSVELRMMLPMRSCSGPKSRCRTIRAV
jgi:hypothetical protein